MANQINPSWAAYMETYQRHKADRIAAGHEWDRFKRSVDSQDKLDVLRAYIKAIWREIHYRSVYWNPAWGDQDQGHSDWLDKLHSIHSVLEQQEAILSHRIDTERYETVDNCRPGPSNRREIRSATSNLCGDPCCGQTFICTEDYNRIVRAQGYPGV